MPSLNSENMHHIWLAGGGAILVLLQSILAGTKRTWYQLLVGCLCGALGAWVAGQVWHDSKYVYIICGVSAVICENLLQGVFNASKEFRDSPIRVISHFAKMFMPTFGKTVGDTSVDEKLK